MDSFTFLRRKLFSVGLLTMSLATGLCLSSCVKELTEETADVATDTQKTGKLKVKAAPAKTAAGTTPKISYPVAVYVFDSKDACVAKTEIGSSSTACSIDLKEGTYTVYALAGVAETDYTLPTKETATKTTVIARKSAAEQTDLMAAHNTVSLVENGTNTLTLSLERKVLAVTDVEISNVPSTVTAVSVSIAPQYQDLTLDGNYQNAGGTTTINLTNETGTKTWSDHNSHYMLEASDNRTTVSVNFTGADGTVKTYSYTTADAFKANYMVSISGTYNEKADVTLTGTLEGATWLGTREVTFTFNESGTSDPQGGSSSTPTTPTQPTVSGAYKAGDLYNDECFVISSTDNGDGTSSLRLMSLKQKKEKVNDNSAQETIIPLANADLPLLAVAGINGWDYGSEGDIRALFALNETFNDKVNTMNASRPTGDQYLPFSTGKAYMFKKANGDYDFIALNPPAEVIDYITVNPSYFCVFTTLTVQNQ